MKNNEKNLSSDIKDLLADLVFEPIVLFALGAVIRRSAGRFLLYYLLYYYLLLCIFVYFCGTIFFTFYFLFGYLGWVPAKIDLMYMPLLCFMYIVLPVLVKLISQMKNRKNELLDEQNYQRYWFF